MSGVESRKVLVSGAAGFLGSHMCDKLLVEGAEVIALDNFITGHARNLAHLEGKPGFLLIEHDITKPIDVGPVDFVINMARNCRSTDSEVSVMAAVCSTRMTRQVGAPIGAGIRCRNLRKAG